MRTNTIGLTMLVGATFIWGTSLVAQSIGMQYMSPFIFNAVRFFIGGFSILVVLLLFPRLGLVAVSEKNNGVISSTRQLLCGGVVCGTILFLAVGLQQIGICTTAVGKTGFITSLYIVFVPLIEFVLGKRLSFTVVLCVFVATVGMYLLCMTESFSLSKGDTYVLLCAVASAIHILLIGYFAPLVHAVRLTCIQFFVCGGLSMLSAIFFETWSVMDIMNGWGAVLYTGILACAVAYTLQALGQRYINPVLSSLIFSLESVFAAVAGWIILGHTFSQRELIGCALIFIAILSAQSPKLWVPGKNINMGH